MPNTFGSYQYLTGVIDCWEFDSDWFGNFSAILRDAKCALSHRKCSPVWEWCVVMKGYPLIRSEVIHCFVYPKSTASMRELVVWLTSATSEHETSKLCIDPPLCINWRWGIRTVVNETKTEWSCMRDLLLGSQQLLYCELSINYLYENIWSSSGLYNLINWSHVRTKLVSVCCHRNRRLRLVFRHRRSSTKGHCIDQLTVRCGCWTIIC